MNQPTTRWRTDDPCPVCGTGLNCTDVGDVTVAQDCPLCGWSVTLSTDQDEGRP